MTLDQSTGLPSHLLPSSPSFCQTSSCAKPKTASVLQPELTLTGRYIYVPDRRLAGIVNDNDDNDGDGDGDSSPRLNALPTMSPTCPTTPLGPCIPVSNAVGEGGTMSSEEKTGVHPVAFSTGLPSGIRLPQLPDPRNVREVTAALEGGYRLGDGAPVVSRRIRAGSAWRAMRALRLGWVLQRKSKNGLVDKHKARLVVRGNHQHTRINYNESLRVSGVSKRF